MPVQCTCLTCGKSFTISPSEVALGRGKYHNRACADAGRTTIVTMVCEQCGTSFDRPINRSRGAVRQFCDEACAGLARRSRVDLTCERCGRAFERNTSAVANGRGRFCGKDCQNAAQENKVSLICETCGTTFERKRSLVRDHTFCSRECDLTKNAQPIILSDDGLTARVPLLARDGSVVAYATIDAADAEWVGQWTWNLSGQGKYAVRGDGIKLHRELLGLTRGDGMEGDHINLDKLDDRRINLREATRPQNAQNLPIRSDATSAHRGVAWNAGRQKWHAYVNAGGKRVYSAFFETEEEAAGAAQAARSVHLPYATN